MELARLKLIKEMQFYAILLYQIRIEYTDRVPTAGVTYKDGSFLMYINRDFFDPLSTKHKAAILRHELDHIVFGHLLRGDKYKDKMRANMAMDIVINQYNRFITDFEGALFPETFKLKPEMNVDHYYDKLPQQDPENQNPSAGGVDSHDWDDIDADGVGKAAIEAATKEVLSKAAQQTKSGDVPGHVTDAISALNPAKLGWKAILRMFAAKAATSTRKLTRSRLNRRFGILVAGRREERKLHLVVCRDTSGSVSQEEHEEFASEIYRIFQTGTKITLIDADYEIQREIEMKNKEDLFTISGRGGTSYEDALNRASELNPDGVIYFGDGDSADYPEKFKGNLLWVISRGGEAPTPYGKVVNLD